jgi:Flp pilus assembly protein TadG
MSGLNKNRRQDETHRLRPLVALRKFARRFIGDKRANVLIMFGLTLPLMLAIVAAGIDFSYAEGAKTTLQDAADAASLAVSAEVVLHPNDTVAQLKTVATAALTADDKQGNNVTITTFQVCAPVAQSSNCTGGLANNTVLVAVQATTTCIPVPIPTTVCQGSPPAMTVTASTTTVIGFGATLQLNVVMDSSASMIVGSTPADVTAIANWVGATTTITEKCGSPSVTQSCTHYVNWNSVASDPVIDVPVGQTTYFTSNNQSNGTKGDNPPCAFACHDEGNSTTAADIQLGLTRATAAGATTRFQVMISAGQDLINHVSAEVNSTTALAKNNYVFNLFSFDDTLHKYGATNMACNSTANGGCAAPLTAMGTVAPGLDTYIDNAMATFAGSGTNSIGANGTGASVSSPLKFLLLVTDGLQSDRNKNWQNCTSWGNFAPWSWANACLAGAFANPLNTANCTTLKNEGVVLAVLETPYVPLTGMDPQETPYEGDVRDQIYPTGPTASSTVSAALAACATTGYYFQAVNSSDISTGFTALTDKFLQHSARISQ